MNNSTTDRDGAGRNPAEVTYYYERWRAVSSGIIESAGTTFLLLIAVRAFHAGTMPKALLASAANAGLLLSPWVVSRVQASGWPISRAMACLAGIGAGCFFTAFLFPILPVFVVCSMLGLTAASSLIPLLTQMYQENYPAAQRGKLFSRAVMIRVGVAILFSHFAGQVLTGDIQRFPWLLLVFAGAFAFSSFCVMQCPTRRLGGSAGAHPLHALRFVKEDRLFRLTLLSWMIVGSANLMMMPLRVEYLANPKYGLHLDVAAIALFTSVAPNCARLVMSPIWGWLFDRANFFVLRIILNLGFILGILTFFTGTSLAGLWAGALIFGIATAGGDVAWSLWVTKFAPPERVADYMAVHTCFTGLRGLIAPMVGFHLVAHFGIGWMGVVSAGISLIGSSILLLEIKQGKRTPPTAALVEEVSE